MTENARGIPMLRAGRCRWTKFQGSLCCKWRHCLSSSVSGLFGQHGCIVGQFRSGHTMEEVASNTEGLRRTKKGPSLQKQINLIPCKESSKRSFRCKFRQNFFHTPVLASFCTCTKTHAPNQHSGANDEGTLQADPQAQSERTFLFHNHSVRNIGQPCLSLHHHFHNSAQHGPASATRSKAEK